MEGLIRQLMNDIISKRREGKLYQNKLAKTYEVSLKSMLDKLKNESYSKKTGVKEIRENVVMFEGRFTMSYKLKLAMNNLYKTNMFSPKVRQILEDTLSNSPDMKVIVHSNNDLTEIVNNHVKSRVPIYINNNLERDRLNESIYKVIIGNSESINNNNKNLNNIETENPLLNYVVVGEMNVLGAGPGDKYRAVHAFAPNFESNQTPDYKYFINGNNNDCLKKKIKRVYENIFGGIEKFDDNKEGSCGIVIPAIGLGSYLTAFRDTSRKNDFIRMTVQIMLDVIVEKIKDNQKVYIVFLDSKNEKSKGIRKEEVLKEEFSKLKNELVEASALIISGRINIEHKNLFTTIPEDYKYYVNAWDTRSFIGNRLKYDQSVDGMFVGGFGNDNINKNVINNSYFHNKVIFN